MTDVISDTEIGDTDHAGAASDHTPDEAPAKVKPEPHVCLCATFLLQDPADAETTFDTECAATTMRVFAQGHDARLVSFLVSGQFDGYDILQRVNDSLVKFEDAPHALGQVSNALAVKAEGAVANTQAKLDVKNAKQADRDAKRAEREQEKAAKKAEREKVTAEKKAEKERVAAEKTAAKQNTESAAPREVPVQVRAEDGAPAAIAQEDGTKLVQIKVGRYTYDAVLSADGSTVTYRDQEGAEQERDTDTVRMLSDLS